MTMAPFASSAKTLLTEVGKSDWSAPSVPPTMLSASPTILAISVRASLTDWSVQGISWLEQLVVHVAAGRAQVDVLEEVGEGPPLGSADRVGGQAGGLDRLGVREELIPVLRGLDAGVLEGLDVVPVGRLVGRLEEEGVELVVERPHLEDRLAEVLGDGFLREVDRLQRAALDVALDEARLGNDGDRRRVAALDRRRQHGRQRVARRVVADVDVRVLLVEARR